MKNKCLWRFPIVLVLNLCVLNIWLIAAAAGENPQTHSTIENIQFGSCIQQDLPTPIFQTMLSGKPDLLLFLGDNIYADTSDMLVMREKYQRLAANEEFQALRSSCPVLATWDDHDLGKNDGGADFPARAASEKEFLRFWNEPADSPRWRRAGVYDARILGPEGKRVQVVVLDTRSFRSPLKQGPRRVGGPYVRDEDPDKTMLGEDQWNWLEQQLRKPAELRVIVSSIQFVADASGQETWSNLPREKARMIQLIRQTEASGVIFISGDRHWSEMSAVTEGVDYPLFDLTSSSFNQIHARGTPTENRYRVIDKTFHRENYGVISIDWQRDDPIITMSIRDIDGAVQLEQRLALSQLRRS